jgi:hypothetical protein
VRTKLSRLVYSKGSKGSGTGRNRGTGPPDHLSHSAELSAPNSPAHAAQVAGTCSTAPEHQARHPRSMGSSTRPIWRAGRSVLALLLLATVQLGNASSSSSSSDGEARAWAQAKSRPDSFGSKLAALASARHRLSPSNALPQTWSPQSSCTQTQTLLAWVTQPARSR